MSKPVGFQIRHKEDGVYQGEFLGMAFFHPMSEQPEQGYCELPSEEICKEIIEQLVVHSRGHLKSEDFTIEEFNVKDCVDIMLTAYKDMTITYLGSPEEREAEIVRILAHFS